MAKLVPGKNALKESGLWLTPTSTEDKSSVWLFVFKAGSTPTVRLELMTLRSGVAWSTD